jgi:hypothetical protein
MWCLDGLTGGGWSFMTRPALPMQTRFRLQGSRSAGPSGVGRADLNHGRQFNQFRLVLVGMVLAEKQLGT